MSVLRSTPAGPLTFSDTYAGEDNASATVVGISVFQTIAFVGATSIGSQGRLGDPSLKQLAPLTSEPYRFIPYAPGRWYAETVKLLVSPADNGKGNSTPP